jgi:hypothetical protein
MSIVTVDKSAIAHNEKNNCWQSSARRNPIRVSKTPNDKNPTAANLVEIKDKFGATVAVVASSRDGKPIENHGTTVVIFTEYNVGIKA